MTSVRNDASLKGKIRNLASEKGLHPQEVLQMYLFEHLLIRLEKSPFANKFVLKGGLLISAMTGIHQRTTMDMDTTAIGIGMDERTISSAIMDICEEDVGDGMRYRLAGMEPIRNEDDYANWRAHINVTYGKIDATVKVDITTGDSIFPPEVRQTYSLMFEQGSIEVLSYHPATILAEKLETVLRRGSANTRGRDFYDLYILRKTCLADLDPGELREAILATCKQRGSIPLLDAWSQTMGDLQSSEAMRKVWRSYIESAPYASGVTFAQAIDSAVRILEVAGF